MQKAEHATRLNKMLWLGIIISIVGILLLFTTA